MTMCTVQSIKEAIRENCQSQNDMESTDIDRVMQTLPFSPGGAMLQSGAPKDKPPYRFCARTISKVLKAAVFLTKDCGFFHTQN